MSKYESFKNTIKNKFNKEISTYEKLMNDKYCLITPYSTTYAGMIFWAYRNDYHDLFSNYSIEDIKDIMIDKDKLMSEALIWYRDKDTVQETGLIKNIKDLNGTRLKEYLNILSEYTFYKTIYDYCYKKYSSDDYDFNDNEGDEDNASTSP